MMNDNDKLDELSRQLEEVIALMKIGFGSQIQEVRTELEGDDTSSTILELARGEWIAAGQLRETTVRRTGQAKRTVQRKIARLISIGALQSQGSGPLTRYRATGIL